jgi:DNA-binding protein Fis
MRSEKNLERENIVRRRQAGRSQVRPSDPKQKQQGAIKRLEELSQALSVAAEALELTQGPIVREGIDFYEEVRRLEITLIEQALKYTAGSQVKAASLLKLNVTTLNTKIKNYRIAMPVGRTFGR